VGPRARRARRRSGDIVGYLFSADDRVERRKQLEQQRERLEEFASVVSHDLRNPLSVAVGNIELAREFDGEEVDERLDRAHDARSTGWTTSSRMSSRSLARGRSVEETATTDLRVSWIRPGGRSAPPKASSSPSTRAPAARRVRSEPAPTGVREPLSERDRTRDAGNALRRSRQTERR